MIKAVTVYVDDMEAPFYPPHRPGTKYVMSHMIADSEQELHDMAEVIGLARRWFQGDHYDVTQTMKDRALKAGAEAITWRQLGMMLREKRETGKLGRPRTGPEIRRLKQEDLFGG
jgi:Protein of unknown function (DUF4031)